MTKVNRFGAALGLVRMTLKNTEQAPSLGPLDAPVVARATRVALATRALTTSARMLCPTLHAHATAASALMSVKVLFKQPPLRAGIARAIKGTKGEMSEAERIALWHTRYRWAALRLVKHIPSDPVRAIDTAPLMGLMAFVQGVSMRVGSMNLSEGGPNGSFSMSFPASWNQAKRAKRKSAFGSKRAIAAEAKIHPIDILNIAQISMRGARGQRRIAAPEREADALEHSPPAAEEGAGSSSDVYTGGDVSEDRNVDHRGRRCEHLAGQATRHRVLGYSRFFHRSFNSRDVPVCHVAPRAHVCRTFVTSEPGCTWTVEREHAKARVGHHAQRDCTVRCGVHQVGAVGEHA